MSNTAAAPRVSIILVNWNGLSDTLECLESLSRVTYPNAHAVVVDNGSRDDEASAIRARFPGEAVLATGENLGFSGGNNVGIRHALERGADYVLCLNNDTTVASDFLEPLVGCLEADPSVGMAVSKIFYYDSPEETWFLGAVCGFDRPSLERGTPAWHPPHPEHQGLTEPFETQIATGCALLIRAEVMRRLGGFDRRYFAYFEDVELSLRAAALGIRRVVVPASRVWHKVSRASGGQDSPNVLYYLIRNTFLLASSHAGGGGIAYKRAFARRWLGWVNKMALDRPVPPRNGARAQAIVSAICCARLGLYGRREDHPRVERAADVGLTLALPVLPLATRVYWSLSTRVARPARALGLRFYRLLDSCVLRRLRRA